MHLKAALLTLAIAAITFCYGAPQLGSTKDLNPADTSTFQTTGQVIDDISDDVSPVSSDLSEFESSEIMPFRRDLNSAVADNVDILLERKDATTTNGFVDFAKAVARSIDKVKRSFPKYCGHQCIKKRSPIPAAIETPVHTPAPAYCGKDCKNKHSATSTIEMPSHTPAPAYCGHTCIKKRAALQAAAAAKRDGGSEECCGKDCKNGASPTSTVEKPIKTRAPAYCGHTCIKKRARSLLGF